MISDAGLPKEFSSERVEAVEQPRAAEREKFSVAKGRRGARADAGHGLLETGRVFVRPEFLAALDIIANDDFTGAALLLREKALGNDDHGGPGRADRTPPKLCRW